MPARRPALRVALAAGLLRAAAAFVPLLVVPLAPPAAVPARCPPLRAGGPPVIRNWRYRPATRTIAGVVTNHPTIPDGEKIATSAVKNPAGIDEDLVVTTQSGSKYKLGNVARGSAIPALRAKKIAEKTKAKEAAEKATTEKAPFASVLGDLASSLLPRKSLAPNADRRRVEEKRTAAAAAAEKKQAAAAARKATTTPVAAKTAPPTAKPKVAVTPAVDLSALQKRATTALALTGANVGDDGRYLLAGRARQSNGRAAKIWTAYLADPDRPGVPLGFDGGGTSKVQQLTIKLSPDVERMKLENTNYDKVQRGVFSGRFVRKMEYISAVSSNKRDMEGNSALVIEAGRYDLKALLAARQGRPLRGRALRDIAVSAGQCVQAVHSSRLVWTDLKTENFIVVNTNTINPEVDDTNGKLGLPGVKGIDLESVIQRGGNPIDYSPEACPPEFARAFMGGEGGDFVLDYAYDMWSLGMMLYEVATGRAYFKKKPPREVTKLLCSERFEVDVGAVPDEKLRDLIGQCLSLEARRRPDITGFLLHPYFITTGIGPLSF